MKKNKLYIHSHHIASHFTNGLLPVGTLLLTLYYFTGNANFEISAFYCFVFVLISAPPVFFSGFTDWKKRFMGKPTRIFRHKRIFGTLLMITSVVIVVWRTADPSVAYPETDLRYIYIALVYTNLALVSYLGLLGGKFI